VGGVSLEASRCTACIGEIQTASESRAESGVHDLRVVSPENGAHDNLPLPLTSFVGRASVEWALEVG
jgi:hypothetical protein